MHKVDYLVVGSGLTGATIARTLFDAGREVLVLERRSHVGGNVHDHGHPSGIRIHTYGPHYFRTNSEQIWRFVNRFARFYRYEATLKTLVDGSYENWPIAGSYLKRAIGDQWRPDFQGVPTNFEEASLALMPRVIYEKFVKGYTEKQWGVSASTLSADLVKRFDVREDDEPRLVRHRYQGIPEEGYAVFMEHLLRDIPVMLNVDYLRSREDFRANKYLVFTGPIDELFNFELSRLVYRGQSRDHRYIPDIEFAQPCGQVNNPDPGNGPRIRTIEWKHMIEPPYGAQIRGTVLTDEVPFSPTDPDQYEYPFPDQRNARLYEKYRQRADATPGLLVCGRLGEYKYYDMDQALGRAQVLAARLLAKGGRKPAEFGDG